MLSPTGIAVGTVMCDILLLTPCSTGISLQAMDSSHVSLVSLLLRAGNTTSTVEFKGNLLILYHQMDLNLTDVTATLALAST